MALDGRKREIKSPPRHHLEKDANSKREPRQLGVNGNIQGDSTGRQTEVDVATRTKMPKADYWTTSDLLVVELLRATRENVGRDHCL